MACGFDISAVVDALHLDDVSNDRVWRFKDRGAADTDVILEVHAMRRPDGSSSLKATCRRHRDCVLWVTKRLHGADRLSLLIKYLEWGSLRSLDEDGHFRALWQVKREYGMQPRLPKKK